MNYELQIVSTEGCKHMESRPMEGVDNAVDAMTHARHLIEFHIGCPSPQGDTTMETLLNAVVFRVLEAETKKVVGLIRPAEIWGNVPDSAGGGLLQ